MINKAARTNVTVIGHVSGINQLGRVLHELITFSFRLTSGVGRRLLESSAVCCESEG